jgi:hypothetical protein
VRMGRVIGGGRDGRYHERPVRYNW